MPTYLHPNPAKLDLGMVGQRARDRLVERLQAAGIGDLRVLAALRSVPRHVFVDEALASRAYEDTALPIGLGQTISQPYVVARMTEALARCEPWPRKVLEIGTGCGYQTAVLATLFERIYTVERIEELLRAARRRLRQLGFENVRSKHADGQFGWPDEGPYDAVIVTAAGPRLPRELLEQVAPGGVVVAPIGPPQGQVLTRWRLDPEQGWQSETLDQVVFVPLRGGIE